MGWASREYPGAPVGSSPTRRQVDPDFPMKCSPTWPIPRNWGTSEKSGSMNPGRWIPKAAQFPFPVLGNHHVPTGTGICDVICDATRSNSQVFLDIQRTTSTLPLSRRLVGRNGLVKASELWTNWQATVRDQEVGGSNPLAPTNSFNHFHCISGFSFTAL